MEQRRRVSTGIALHFTCAGTRYRQTEKDPLRQKSWRDAALTHDHVTDR